MTDQEIQVRINGSEPPIARNRVDHLMDLGSEALQQLEL